MPKERITMYAAIKDEQVVGVFAEESQARHAHPGLIVPISVRKPEGTPDPVRRVVVARGIRHSISLKDGILEVEAFDVGPSWGVSTVSAIDGLCDIPTEHAGVEITSCRKYPVGQLLTDVARPEEADALDLVTAELVNLGSLRVKEPGYFCGTYLRRTSQKVRNQLRRSFTPQEIRTLAVLMALRRDAEIQTRIDSGEISHEDCSRLQERIKSLVPVMQHTMARFSPDFLKD